MPSRVRKTVNIRRQLRKLLLTIALPMVAIIILLIGMLLSVRFQYHQVLQNANTAADFNQEFKQTIDTKMYNHVIQPRTGQDEALLPLSDLDEAEEVLHRLEATTVLRDNSWRIHSMLNMCESLRNYMMEIADCQRYDDRMELLERNIRGETGLTLLIETYMNNYINDEVRELSRLDKAISQQTAAVIAVILVGTAILLLGMLLYSLTIARRIAKPITSLADEVAHMGQNGLAPIELDSRIAEVQTLNQGFTAMTKRIQSLMAKQMDDQRSLHRAELELLQAQINPHFLYNTLDSIAILADLDRKEDVVKMVTSLSVFFRNSLSRGQDIISLQVEREQVTSYLDIQQIRYSDILQYSIDIPEALMGCMVPKLILQPLVENALYHGIKSRRGLGKITITGEEAGDCLRLTVTDNGMGMTEEQLCALRAGVYEDNHTGLGLVNVHKRIKLYCGEQYGLTFDSTVGQGTTVTVLLPKNLSSETEVA